MRDDHPPAGKHANSHRSSPPLLTRNYPSLAVAADPFAEVVRVGEGADATLLRVPHSIGGSSHSLHTPSHPPPSPAPLPPPPSDRPAHPPNPSGSLRTAALLGARVGWIGERVLYLNRAWRRNRVSLRVRIRAALRSAWSRRLVDALVVTNVMVLTAEVQLVAEGRVGAMMWLEGWTTLPLDLIFLAEVALSCWALGPAWYASPPYTSLARTLQPEPDHEPKKIAQARAPKHIPNPSPNHRSHLPPRSDPNRYPDPHP